MTTGGQLDAIDWKILRELSRTTGASPMSNLPSKVGLSPPPCLRRVRALEKAGYIAGYRAISMPRSSASRSCSSPWSASRARPKPNSTPSRRGSQSWPLVRECYAVSGEADFILKCVGANLHAMQDFIIKELTAAAQCRQREDDAHPARRQIRARNPDRMSDASEHVRGPQPRAGSASPHRRSPRSLSASRRTILLIMEAADAVGANPAQKASWAAALCYRHGDHDADPELALQDADHHRMVDAGRGAHCHERWRHRL